MAECLYGVRAGKRKRGLHCSHDPERAGGEKVPDMAARQVPDVGLGSVNHFFAQWYNDNKMIYDLIVTVIMCALGMLIALVTDILLKAIGMDVSKIEHHE